MGLQLNHITNESWEVLEAEGNMTRTHVPLIRAALQRCLDSSNLHGVIIDFEQVQLLDSSGVAIIVKTYKRLHAHNIPLILCSLQHEHRQIFQITQLDQILSIYESRKAAILHHG